jgi:hypothetical protein
MKRNLLFGGFDKSFYQHYNESLTKRLEAKGKLMPALPFIGSSFIIWRPFIKSVVDILKAYQ